MIIIATDIATCPPHHWDIDWLNRGKCKKCPATKDFNSKWTEWRENVLQSGEINNYYSRRNPIDNYVF